MIAVAVLFVLPAVSTFKDGDIRYMGGDHLRCLIDLECYNPRSFSYPVGYNYQMLREFASTQHRTADISLADSLSSAEEAAIVVRPYSDSLPGLVSHVLADSTVWVVRDEEMLRVVNRWLKIYSYTADYKELVAKFSPSYEPFRRAASGRQYPFAGPYDDLVMAYASSLGWDWHLLEALLWQESRFHIEVHSRRGAAGLMQMMPATAKRYGVQDALDPEENIAAGVNYLRRLQNMFAPYASGAELARFTLAAYNAGEGRVLDCIRFAQSIGKPCSSWADLEAVIPYMRPDSLSSSDTVLRLGPFKGKETIAYIHLTDSLASAFRTIRP